MRRGIALAGFFVAEAERLMGHGEVDPETTDAAAIERWLIEKGKTVVTMVELGQYGPGGLRSVRKLEHMRSIARLIVLWIAWAVTPIASAIAWSEFPATLSARISAILCSRSIRCGPVTVGLRLTAAPAGFQPPSR